MQTRSMTKRFQQARFTVDIDFDGAISAWNLNKKKLHDCTYKYICMHFSISGKKCGKSPLVGLNYCKTHSK